MTTKPVTELTKTDIREMLETSDKALCRGVLAIYARQTADEQSADSTIHHNKMGFSGLDAEFLSSIARQLQKGRTLSEKQLIWTRKKMLKYSGQLLIVAQEKAATAAPAPASVTVLDSAEQYAAWTKISGTDQRERWTAEISEFRSYNMIFPGKGGKEDQFQTPFGLHRLSDFTTQTDNEGDVSCWLLETPSYAMTIFND